MTKPLTLLAADFAKLFLGLLPRGRIWRSDQDSVEVQTITALMKTWERLQARANNLLIDAFPSTTVELLPEWEASLGLPDPCAGNVTLTIAQRQAQVVARLTARGGQGIPYFVAFIKALGWTPATITTFAPWRCGISCCADPLRGQAWAFAWQIAVHLTGVPTAVLECEVRARAPANTIPIFVYGLFGDEAFDTSIGATVWLLSSWIDASGAVSPSPNLMPSLLSGWDTAHGLPVWNLSPGVWIDGSGAVVVGAVVPSGTIGLVGMFGPTSGRPGSPVLGQRYLDTSLSRPDWWNGAAWVNFSGGAP